MRFLIGADLHFGNHRRHGGATQSGVNERARDILHVLLNAIRLSIKLDATLVLAGDTLDESRPTPGILAALQHALASAKHRPVLLTGNHEWGSATDHALRPMWNVADVVEELGLYTRSYGPPATQASRLMCWPWWPGRERFEVSRFTIAGGRPSVLVMHTGVIHDETPPYLITEKTPTADEVFEALDALGASVAVTGDWHDHKVLERVGSRGQDLAIIQCGALVPTGFDNQGLDYGYLVLIDDEDPTAFALHRLDGPRFVRPASLGEATQTMKEAGWSKLYVEALSEDVALAVEAMASDPELTKHGRTVKVDRLPVSVTDRAALMESVGDASLDRVVREWAKANAPAYPDLADELLRRLQAAKDKIVA